MKHAALKTTLAAVALAAAVGSVQLAAPAGAATAPKPATQHCSGYKQAGSTGYFVKECAQIVKYASGKYVKETAYLKNTGRHNLAVTGFIAVSYGQAGDGADLTDVTVAPHKSKQITHLFGTEMSGPYTALSSITVGGHTAKAQSTFRK